LRSPIESLLLPAIEEFELVDETGSVVAREGDRLNLTGGRIDPRFDFYACRVEVAN
jgi:hypothetical protein